MDIVSPYPRHPTLQARSPSPAARGRHDATICTARISVPSLARLLFQRFTGVKLAEGDPWHRVILGRACLRRYRMSYDGETGRWRSWRIEAWGMGIVLPDLLLGSCACPHSRPLFRADGRFSVAKA